MTKGAKLLDQTYDVLTNRIEKFRIDYNRIGERFDFYSVDLGEDTDDSEYTDSDEYQKKVVEFSLAAKNSRVVLSSLHYKNRAAKYFMVFKGASISALEKYRPVLVEPEDLLEFIREGLLSHAVPSLLEEMYSVEVVADRKGFVSGDRYYRLVRPEMFEAFGNYTDGEEKKTKRTLVAIGVSPEGDWSLTAGQRPLYSVLKSVTTTFTSVDYIREWKPSKRIVKLLARERFDVSDLNFVVKKSSKRFKGEFVKGTTGKRKNRTDAYHINHKGITKDPSETRAGMLFKFLEDFDLVHKGAAEIKLQRYNFDQCYDFGALEAVAKKEFKAIRKTLINFAIRIVNHSERAFDGGLVDQIIEVLNDGFGKGDEKIEVLLDQQPASDPQKKELVLLITEPVSFYDQNKDRQDPYKVFKYANPEIISQGVTFDNLFSEDDDVISLEKTQFHCAISQLIYKLEIASSQFMIDRPAIPERAWFIEAVRIDDVKKGDDESEYLDEDEDEEDNAQFLYYKGLIDQGELKFSELTGEELKTVEGVLGKDSYLLFGKIKSNGKRTVQRHPVMIYENSRDYIVFAKTNYSAIPSHWDQEEERTAVKGSRTDDFVDREFIEQYMQRVNIPESVVERIETGLAEQPDRKYFDFETVDNWKLGDRARFLSAVDEALGYRWKDLVRTSEYRSLVIHHMGANFDTKKRIYFVGGKGGYKYAAQKNFSTIYALVSNMHSMPEDLHTWFMSFSVRNMQTTVYPFFFKHVREFAAMSKFGFGQTQEEQGSLEEVDKQEEESVQPPEPIFDFN